MKYSNANGSIDRETAEIRVSGKISDEFKAAVKKYKNYCVKVTHPTTFDPVLDPTLPRIGPWLTAGDDVILDFIGGVATRVLGAHHPKVREMLDKCHEYGLTEFKDAGTDFYYYNDAGLPMIQDLAEQIIKLTNEEFNGDYMICPVNTGAEAVANCVKISCYNKYLKIKEELGDELYAEMCKQLNIKTDPALDHEVYLDYPLFGIAFIGGFHGRTMDMLSLTKSKPKHKVGYPQIPWKKHFPYNQNDYVDAVDMTPLKELITENKLAQVVFEENKIPAGLLAYIVAEPVQGEGGYHVAQAPFIRGIADFAQKCGARYISDEVQAGMGRTGKLWAAGHFGVQPDCISSAKALLMGASIVKRELGETMAAGQISTTWGGGDLIRNCQTYATIDAMFNYQDPEIENRTPIDNCNVMGEYFRGKLNGLMEKYPDKVTSIRGIGMMNAISIINPEMRDTIEEKAWEKGMIVLGCGTDAIRFLPPIDIRTREIDAGIAVLDECLKEV